MAWVEKHGKADYMWMKQAICAYVARQAFPLLKQGIRINAHLPRPDRHPAGAGQQGDVARASVPTTAARPGSRPPRRIEQAYPLVFLCSDAASGDQRDHDDLRHAGYMSSGVTGSYPEATAIANLLLNR